MNMSIIAISFLVAVSVAGLFYVFIDPFVSGESKITKRKNTFVATEKKDKISEINNSIRKGQVSQALKEMEGKINNKKYNSLNDKLFQAGLDISQQKYYFFSILLSLVLGFFAFSLSGSLYVAIGAIFIGFFGIPSWILLYLKKKRIQNFINELPNAMDVIARGIRSGLPLGDCLRMIAAEAQEPLKTEFKKVIDTNALGVPLGESISKIYERVPVAEANFFAIVIAIQQKSGGNLAEALLNLSKVLRERKKMSGKIKAMSMEAKASAAIIACLPFTVATMTYITSPDYIQLLWTTQAGQTALVGAGIWMTIGVFTMKKMINFDF
jgi:tight adherence protein B